MSFGFNSRHSHQIQMRQRMDIYDNAEWTDMDIDDLKAAIAAGRPIEEVAEFLCRSETVEDVRRKAVELGLIQQKAR